MEQYLHVSVNIVGDCVEFAPLDQQWLEVFNDINTVLASAGLPAFAEPDHAVEWDPADEGRLYDAKIPVTALYCLKRAYALVQLMSQMGHEPGTYTLPPVADEGLSAWNKAIDAEICRHSSHLVCHSDASGVYLPMEDLQTPLLASQVCSSVTIEGDVIGSSYHLLDELLDLAPSIGIELNPDGELTAEEATRTYQASQEEGELYGAEKRAWLTLHACAEMSIHYQSAIVFQLSSS